MAYIGSTPTSQNFISGTDYFSGTGSQTAFTLTRTVNSVNDIEVVINNVVQQPNTAYTLSGTTITFTSAPSSGTNNIYVRYLSTNMQSFTVPANSVTRNQLDSNLQAGFQGRNRIINGSCIISQRGTSPTITGGGEYSLDRFLNYYSGNAYTSVQSSLAPSGFVNSMLFTITTPSASPTYSFFGQRIEGYNVADLNWGTTDAKTITLSFWVRSSVAGVYSVSFGNANADRNYPVTYTITSANTWQQVTITIPGDTTGTWNTTNGIGIQVRWNLGTSSAGRLGTSGSWQAGNFDGATGSTGANTWANTSGATFYITGVQLEEGTTATSFERESYSVTLQKCQRYFVKYLGNSAYEMPPNSLIAANTTSAYGYIGVPVQLRTLPSISGGNLRVDRIVSGTAASAIAIDSGYNSTISAGVNVTSSGLTSGLSYFVTANATTTAYIYISAEL